ncbi:carboxypeptidase-like regulatory domain-containing protein, partial [Halalkalibaculum sp. DA3122]|uniref:carboxypeptidase-like regulatory domain-containing protein n=1 Tax=unclassified Halalkalibaculum TaxID=2964617 RepID=UPI0037547A73
MFNKYSIGILVLFIVLGWSSAAGGQVLVDNFANENQHNLGQSSSQELLQTKISLSVNNLSLKNVLHKVQRKSGVHLFYTRDMLQGNPKVSLQFEEESLGKILDRLLKPQGLDYWATGRYIILQKKQRTPILETVSGQVTDASSGDPLPGVNVVIKGTTQGTATGSDGEYELPVNSLQDTLVFSFIGYQTREVPINGRTQIDA